MSRMRPPPRGPTSCSSSSRRGERSRHDLGCRSRTPSAQASTEAIETFCLLPRRHREPPSAICYPNSPEDHEPTFAVLRSFGDLEYEVCQTARPRNPPRGCASAYTPQPEHQRGPALLRIGRSHGHLAALGHRRTDSYPRPRPRQRGSSTPPAPRTNSTVRLHRQLVSGAFFPVSQRHSKACRKVYARPSGRIAVCFIEYVLGGEWHLLRGVESIPPGPERNRHQDRLRSGLATRDEALPAATWRPRQADFQIRAVVARCPTATLSSSPGSCCPNIRAGQTARIHQLEADPAPTALRSSRAATRVGNSLRFNNEVGDWLASTP